MLTYLLASQRCWSRQVTSSPKVSATSDNRCFPCSCCRRGGTGDLLHCESHLSPRLMRQLLLQMLLSLRRGRELWPQMRHFTPCGPVARGCQVLACQEGTGSAPRRDRGMSGEWHHPCLLGLMLGTSVVPALAKFIHEHLNSRNGNNPSVRPVHPAKRLLLSEHSIISWITE